MKKILYLLVLMLFGVFPVFTQHRLNLADENIFSIGQLVIRHRPVVYSEHINEFRTALMVGRTFRGMQKNQSVTTYVYWKHSASNAQHLGFRVDIDQTFFENKLFTRLQTMVFWGLSEDNDREYFIIPAINYKVGPLRLGPWGMFIYKKKEGELEGGKLKLPLKRAYLGPSMILPFSKNAGVFIAYVVNLKHRAKNQFGSNAYLLHTVFFTRFQLKRKRL